MLAHIHRHGCTCTDTNRHAKSADRPTPSHMRRPAYTHTHTHSKALWEGWGGRWGKHGCMFMCTICICIQSVCVCVSEGLAVTPVEVACRHAVCVWGVCSLQVHHLCHCATVLRLSLRRCVSHSALGMMVKGRMGLLASSSKAVRKHSVAAAAFP